MYNLSQNISIGSSVIDFSNVANKRESVGEWQQRRVQNTLFENY